jgi:putative addiction module antidote
MVLTIRKVGNSLGTLLPAKVIQKLQVGEGDKLFVTETPGGIYLTPYDPEFADTMGLVREGMRRYRTALRDLAK